MLMQEIKCAVREDWLERRICLPSLAAAIIIEGISTEKIMERESWKRVLCCWQQEKEKNCAILKQAVVLHNNYLSAWKSEEQEKPNWHKLIGEKNYIRAVQFLQDAAYPYCRDKNYEKKLVEIIEKYRLYEMDEEETVSS